MRRLNWDEERERYEDECRREQGATEMKAVGRISAHADVRGYVLEGLPPGDWRPGWYEVGHTSDPNAARRAGRIRMLRFEPGPGGSVLGFSTDAFTRQCPAICAGDYLFRVEEKSYDKADAAEIAKRLERLGWGTVVWNAGSRRVGFAPNAQRVAAYEFNAAEFAQLTSDGCVRAIDKAWNNAPAPVLSVLPTTKPDPNKPLFGVDRGPGTRRIVSTVRIPVDASADHLELTIHGTGEVIEMTGKQARALVNELSPHYARANKLSDQNGALKTERDELLIENARLRRDKESLERKLKGVKR